MKKKHLKIKEKPENSKFSGLIFFVLNILGSVLNLGFNIVGLALIDNDEVGSFGSMMGVFNLISTSFLSTLQTYIVIRLSSENSDFYTSFKKSVQTGLILGIIIFIITCFLEIFHNELGFKNAGVFVLLGFNFLLTTYFLSPINGTLQQKKAFVILGLNAFLLSFFKIVFFVGISFSALINPINTASLSMGLASFVAMIQAIFYFKKTENLDFKVFIDFSGIKNSIVDFFVFLKNSWSNFFIIISFTSFYSIDQVIINAIRNEKFSAEYTTLAMFIKMAVFPLVAIGTIFFPYITDSLTKSKKHVYQIMKKLILFIFSLCVLGCFPMIIFPEILTEIFFTILNKRDLIYLHEELRILAVFIFFMCMTTPFFYFFIAVKSRFSILIFIFSAILEISIFFRYDNLHEMLSKLWISSLILFIFSFMYFFRKIKSVNIITKN